MPLAKAMTKLATSGTAPTAPMSCTACRASNTPLPAMMMTARRKLNSAASTGGRPRPTAGPPPHPPRGKTGEKPAARGGLREPDLQRSAHRQRLGSRSGPAGRPQNQPGDDERDADESQRSKRRFEPLMEQRAEHRTRNRPDNEEDGVAPVGGIAAQRADNHLPQFPSIHDEHGAERGHVKCDRHEHERVVADLHARERAQQREMPRAGDGEKLGQSLHETEHD